MVCFIAENSPHFMFTCLHMLLFRFYRQSIWSTRQIAVKTAAAVPNGRGCLGGVSSGAGARRRMRQHTTCFARVGAAARSIACSICRKQCGCGVAARRAVAAERSQPRPAALLLASLASAAPASSICREVVASDPRASERRERNRAREQEHGMFHC